MRVFFQRLGVILCSAFLLSLVWGLPEPARAAGGKRAVSSAISTFGFTVLHAPSLSVGGSSGLFMLGLSPGYTYRFEPGPYASSKKLTPIINGAEETVPVELSFTNDGSRPANIAITMELPEVLRNRQGTGTPCFFPDDGLYCVETEQRFNPNHPLQLYLEENETMTLDLGIVVSIPSSAGTEDGYTGTVKTIAHVTGL